MKQGNGTVYELYLDMLGLLQNMGRDPNQCTHDYISKLKHEAVRNALSTASYSDNNLQILAAHADKVERTLGLISKDGGKKNKTNGDPSVSSNRCPLATKAARILVKVVVKVVGVGVVTEVVAPMAALPVASIVEMTPQTLVAIRLPIPKKYRNS